MSDSRNKATSRSGRPRSGRRRIAFRCAAVLFGLLPFVVLEMVSRLLGWGIVNEVEDPFVGFEEVSRLFERDTTGERYAVARSRLGYFRPDSFSAEKGANEYRVFCLGGSTVQGRPYAIETSFTSWLELSLTAADTSRTWRVVNCGGVSYASYRLVPILKEVLDYEADLIIVYTGHNEFLEDRTYEQVKQVSAFLQSAHRGMSRFRIYNLGRSLLRRWRTESAPADQLPGEVETRLDYWGGLNQFQRDPKWRRAVVAHYEHNLRRMVQLCRSRQVPLILVDPVSNLKDAPPFKYQHGSISADDRERFEQLWKKARLKEVSLEERIQTLEAVTRIDPQHAGALFHLGKCYEADRRWAEARACYESALEEDICPLRMIASQHTALRLVARETQTPLVRCEETFRAHSEGRIPGREVFIDHVHPHIRGHKWIAAALLEQLVADEVVSPRPNAEARQRELFRKHSASLDQMYYVRGKERLEGLLNWTKGQVPKYK